MKQPPATSLSLYQSNRLEHLFDTLCRVIAEPLPNPLSPEIIVVQNPGMARWLAQQIALQTGIAANLAFPLPASFFWDIFGRTLGELPDLSEFDRKILLWRIMAELDEMLTTPAMKAIAAYLADDAEGLKRFQLAEKITDTFDQYLVYRPDMILSWERGADDHWQANLWRRLCSNSAIHRATLLQQFTDAASAGTLLSNNLPTRVSFFGINSLAPAYLQIIDLLQPVTDFHIFHLSPCAQAWDDILPERLLALKRRSWRQQKLDDISAYFTTGNPLLASLGAMGQEFFSLLMQLDPQEYDLYQSPVSSNVLGAIQADILELYDRTTANESTTFTPDNSLHFHCCHSPMREVQVLHDRLLDLFAADPDLKPADILIMAPDINEYAPFVSGVFGAATDKMRIPWSIADRTLRAEQPVIEGFMALLEAMSGRFTAPEIMAFFDNPAIASKLGLQKDDLPAIRYFIRKAGVRWGLNSRQRRQQTITGFNLHTWQFGLDRLMMGSLTGALDRPCLDILPCSSTLNSTTSWLGSLANFIYTLQELFKHCQKANSPGVWMKILLNILEDFFDSGPDSDDQDGLLLLREKITSFAAHCEQAGCTDPLRLEVVRQHFTTLLAEPAGGQAFLAGKVTFCNMVPMRSVPFKVIWLLGMNDNAYPRSQRAPAFDLIAQNLKLGDRSRRDDDRYLFLESLLSARKHFALSWVGRDLQTNQPLPPSVVVAELRDYLDRGWQTTEQLPASEQLTTIHPLQPFSARNFCNNPETQSYARLWLPTTDPLKSNTFAASPVTQIKPVPEQIDISQLLKFWNHPVRYFLEQRLGLQLRTGDNTLPESEPFDLDSLQSYLISDTIIPKMNASQELTPLFDRLLAEGEFPVAGQGTIIRQEITTQAKELLATIKDLIQSPVQPIEVDLTVDTIQLTGELTSLYSEGFVSYRPGNCKGKDMLHLWINHLVLNLLQPDGVALHSYHAGKDKCICFKPVDQPEKELLTLLHYFREGQQEPLHFYPQTSYCWAKAKEEERMKKAHSSWNPGYNHNGEQDDLAYAIGLRGQNPLDTHFTELAALFFPIIKASEKHCATA